MSYFLILLFCQNQIMKTKLWLLSVYVPLVVTSQISFGGNFHLENISFGCFCEIILLSVFFLFIFSHMIHSDQIPLTHLHPHPTSPLPQIYCSSLFPQKIAGLPVISTRTRCNTTRYKSSCQDWKRQPNLKTNYNLSCLRW